MNSSIKYNIVPYNPISYNLNNVFSNINANTKKSIVNDNRNNSNISTHIKGSNNENDLPELNFDIIGSDVLLFISDLKRLNTRQFFPPDINDIQINNIQIVNNDSDNIYSNVPLIKNYKMPKESGMLLFPTHDVLYNLRSTPSQFNFLHQGVMTYQNMVNIYTDGKKGKLLNIIA